ncbi:MAG: hypothetical protein JST87_15185 [Bacteroidetes bacterium]|nr:hypothetical protein [Bacteroidota bacterium]MBS1932761.1 hypothetical protein [Bacteroidota bacterium]
MTEDIWKFIFSLSVGFPAIAGVLRFKKIDVSYRPFLIYCFVSLFNELLFGFVIRNSSKSLVTLDWNIFNIFEAIILLIQFQRWGRFDTNKKIFPALIIITILGWAAECFLVHTIFYFNAVFLIIYSFVLVLLSVQTINHIIVNDRGKYLVKNATFIICTAMVIFFIYNIFVFTLLAKGINVNNKAMMSQVFQIRVYVNALTNLLYGVGVCFMQKKFSGKDLFRDLHI